MVYTPRDLEWIPKATDNPCANSPGKNTEHEYHVNTLGWSLQLTNITLIFDVLLESIYCVKLRIKCNLERSYSPPNYAIKAPVIKTPGGSNLCRIFDVGRSHARLIKFQKCYLITNNETNKDINTMHT